MRRTALFVSLVCIASFAFVAGSASADVEECRTAELDTENAVEVCVFDTEEGDLNEDSDATCEDYRAATGASGDADTSAQDAAAEAGGEETCDSFFIFEYHEESIYVEADTDGEAGDLSVDAEWSEYKSYDATGISASVSSGEYGLFAEGTWSDAGFGGCSVDGVAAVFYQGVFLFTIASAPCGEAAPPAPPSPGWGNLTP
jgi:hypothetical protein